MWQTFEEYLTDLEIDKAAAKNTLQSRRRALRDFCEFCESEGVTDINDVTRRHISQYIDYLVEEGYAYSTIIQERYAGVAAALRWAYRERRIDESVMERVRTKAMKKKAREAMSTAEKKKENEPPAHLSKEEVYEVAENVGPPTDRNSLLVKFLFWTGIRASEAELLETGDIDFQKPSVTVYSPKTDTTRKVSYPREEINPELRDWIHNGRLRYKAADESDRLFIGPKGGITTHRINEIVREAAEAAGHQQEARTTKAGQTRSEATAHLLRHSHAMHYLNVEDTDLEKISKHLGHSKISVTKKFYAESTDESIINEFS